MEEPETGLTQSQESSMMPALVGGLDEISKNLADFKQFVGSQMKRGEDFMRIPGTTKDTILKPGMEKLLIYHGFGIEYTCLHDQCVRNTTPGQEEVLMVYSVRVFNKATGATVGDGYEGECSTWEDKYRTNWVWANRLPSKWAAKMEDLPQKGSGKGLKYGIPMTGPEILSQGNTIRKIAQKRAMAGAVLAVCRASGDFTQDLEDMPREQFTEDRNPPKPPVEPISPKQRDLVKKLATADDLDGRSLDAFCMKEFGKHMMVQDGAGTWIPNLTTKEASDLIAALKLKEVPVYAEAEPSPPEASEPEPPEEPAAPPAVPVAEEPEEPSLADDVAGAFGGEEEPLPASATDGLAE